MPPPAADRNSNSELIEHFRLDASDHDTYITISVPDRRRRDAKLHEKWRLAKILGQGSFGLVSLYQATHAEELRAVKRIERSHGESSIFSQSYARELYAMARLSKHSDHFAQFFGWFEDQGCVFLSMEYFPHRDLGHCIQRPVKEREVQSISSQLLSGLQLIHDHGITHRDLKPENIFVAQPSPDWWVKIGDFGISKHIARDSTGLHTQTGTKSYMAPELLRTDGDERDGYAYTNAVDIWALGCVIYFSLTHSLPFSTWTETERFARGVLDFPLQPLKDQAISRAGILFTQALLSVDGTQRPPAKRALEHSWLTQQVVDDSSFREAHMSLPDDLDCMDTSKSPRTSDDSVSFQVASRDSTAVNPIHFPSNPEGKPNPQVELLKNSLGVDLKLDTALLDLAAVGNLAAVQSLLVKGANIEARTEYQHTPLYTAAYNGHNQVVQFLLAKGADIEARDHYQQTPLHAAANNGHDQVVQLLISKGANSLSKDNFDYLPVQYAEALGHTKTVCIIEEAMATQRKSKSKGSL